jgi:hypothetical protein
VISQEAAGWPIRDREREGVITEIATGRRTNGGKVVAVHANTVKQGENLSINLT